MIAMVQLLGGRRAWPVAELADKLETTERTIFRDLSDLSVAGIPVARDEAGYRLMEGATLRPLSLDAQERALLALALGNPVIRKSPQLAGKVEILCAKLAAAGAEERAGFFQLAERDRSGPIPRAVLAALDAAMEQGKSVEIDYSSLRTGKRRWRGVDPWIVFHRGEAWYLAGHCHRHDGPRMFRLDRIAGVRQLDRTFTRPEGFDLDAFLMGAWTIFRGDERHEVVIRFDASMAPLIGNARHHPGEEVHRLPGGDLEYRVTLSDLEEVARWIAGFGGKAVALAPDALVKRVAAIGAGIVAAHPAKRKVAAARRRVVKGGAG